MPGAARRSRPAPAIDIVIESRLWRSEPNAAAVIRRAIGEAAELTSATAGPGELAVMLCDDAAMRELNSRWRGRRESTNVLSFPSAAPGRNVTGMLGDIAIAYETTAREAQAERKAFADHLAHLAVHGFLHLLGYDHQAETQARVMERLEASILARLGIADPYVPDDTAT